MKLGSIKVEKNNTAKPFIYKHMVLYKYILNFREQTSYFVRLQKIKPVKYDTNQKFKLFS